jgi:hypothetical protein
MAMTADCQFFVIKKCQLLFGLYEGCPSFYSGMPLGHDRFKKMIEVMTGRKVGLIKQGRPIQSGRA